MDDELKPIYAVLYEAVMELSKYKGNQTIRFTGATVDIKYETNLLKDA